MAENGKRAQPVHTCPGTHRNYTQVCKYIAAVVPSLLPFDYALTLLATVAAWLLDGNVIWPISHSTTLVQA